MNIRRRLALWLDPSLTPEIRLDFDFARSRDTARHLEHIARAVESIDHKMVKRRPRNIWCEHPELHPEIERAAS